MGRRTVHLMGAAVVAMVAVPATTAAAAGTHQGGEVRIYVRPSPSTTLPKQPGTIVMTGAIGDYGSTVNSTASGKPSSKRGPYDLLRLKKGTILVNTGALTANGTGGAPTTSNTTTCSFSGSLSGSVTIVKGTGAYAGITGSFTVTGEFAGVLPQKKGACAPGGRPLAYYVAFGGSGTVAF